MNIVITPHPRRLNITITLITPHHHSCSINMLPHFCNSNWFLWCVSQAKREKRSSLVFTTHTGGWFSVVVGDCLIFGGFATQAKRTNKPQANETKTNCNTHANEPTHTKTQNQAPRQTATTTRSGCRYVCSNSIRSTDTTDASCCMSAAVHAQVQNIVTTCSCVTLRLYFINTV